ncbi:MAG: hypothetical protein A2Z35_03755, partial [Actinobacteria bacterium RBG_19FT_COMBO_36_27]
DEGSGTSAKDSSGEGNDATLISGPIFSTGKFGNAIKLDGSDDYLNVGSPADLDNLTSFTWGMWYKRSQFPDSSWQSKEFLHKSDYFRFEQYADASIGNFRGIVGYDNTYAESITSDGSVPMDYNWHYIVFRYDENGDRKIHIFLDSIELSYKTNTSSIGNRNHDDEYDLYIGKNMWAYGFEFPGYFDDLKIYNYPRTQVQIIEDMNAGNPTTGTLAGSAYVQYNFDEGNSSTAHNIGSGGTSLNGTISNGSWTNSGKFDKALTFGATTSVDATITDPGYSNSISLWVNPTTSAASKNLVKSGKLTTDSSSRPIYGDCTGSALSLNTWTHIAAVSDGSGVCRLYQNGFLVSSGTTGVSFGTSLKIGDSSFIGSIDEFKFFTFPLTAEQVKIEFNRGTSAVMGATSSTSHILAYDSFTRSDGELGSTESKSYNDPPTPSLPWSGSTWAVSGNKVVNTPNLGSEKIQNGSFETGNPPNNWGAWGPVTTFEQSSTQAQNGTYSLHLITSDNNQGAAQSAGLTNPLWYLGTAYVYPVTYGDYHYFALGNEEYFFYQPLTQWTKLTVISRATTGNVFLGPVYAKEMYYDNVSVKALTLNELFAALPATKSDVTAEVGITLENSINNRIPVGLVLRLDDKDNPQNFLLATLTEGGSNAWGVVNLTKCINGTYTSLFSTHLNSAGTLYSAGTKLKVVLDGPNVKVYYGNTLINTATVSDTEIINNTIHGIFSPYSGDSLDDFTLSTNIQDYTYCVPGDTSICNAPIAEWDFSDGTGQYVYDISGNNNTSTLGSSSSIESSDPTRVTGKIGKGLSFDGNDYVRKTSATTLAQQTITAEAWVYPTTTQDQSVLTYYNYAGSYAYSYAIGYYSGNIFYFFAQTANTNNIFQFGTTKTYPINTWHHVVGQFGSGVAKIFVDGVLDNQTTYTGNIDYSGGQNEFWIGRENVYFNGRIDQVKIYDYFRTPAQIAWDYNLGAPIAHYRFDECQGTTIHNSVSNSNGQAMGYNGTISPGAGDYTSAGTCNSGASSEMWNNGTNGNYSASLGFDGVDDYVSGADIDYGADNQVTVSAWFKYSSCSGDSSQCYLVSKGQYNASNPYQLWVSNQGSTANFVVNGTTVAASGSYNDNSWHQVVGTLDGSTCKIFIDGVYKNSESCTPVSNNELVTIGGDDADSTYRPFNGQIDDVRIYNYALTAIQIKTLYNENSAVRFY